jgi:hypothetical protein
MIIEYSIGDTAPAIDIEIDNFDLTADPATTVEVAIGMTAGNKLIDLAITSATTAAGNPGPTTFDEAGKFPAEIIVTTSAIVETYRGFYVRVYESLAP